VSGAIRATHEPSLASRLGPSGECHGYRGWSISFEYGYFNATGPNYDASYEGPEDGWVSNGEQVSARTRDDVIEMIDDWIEENGQ